MDVFAVATPRAEAIDQAGRGGGPTLIEAMTYRYGGQYEGDSQTYKPPDEVDRNRADAIRSRSSGDRTEEGRIDEAS